MANFAINVTDAGDDTWTLEVLRAPTLATGGTALANGATTAGNFHVAIQKAVEAVKNRMSVDSGI